MDSDKEVYGLLKKAMERFGNRVSDLDGMYDLLMGEGFRRVVKNGKSPFFRKTSREEFYLNEDSGLRVDLSKTRGFGENGSEFVVFRAKSADGRVGYHLPLDDVSRYQKSIDKSAEAA